MTFDFSNPDFTVPFPNDRNGADFEKKELISEIVMVRDQLDAVADGDMAAPHNSWVLEKTEYRRRLQSRCNRLDLAIKAMPPRRNQQMIDDERRRSEKEDRRRITEKQLEIAQAKVANAKNLPAEQMAKFKAIKDYVRLELGGEYWVTAKAKMDAAQEADRRAESGDLVVHIDPARTMGGKA